MSAPRGSANELRAFTWTATRTEQLDGKRRREELTLLLSGVAGTEDGVDVISGVVCLELVQRQHVVSTLGHQLLVAGVRSLPQPGTRTHTTFLRFYRASYASAVLGVVILSARLSVSPSVRPSHACFVTNPKNLPAIFLYHTKGQSF